MTRRLQTTLLGLLMLLVLATLAADAADDGLAHGLAAIRSMTGCYLVDCSLR